MNRPHSTQVASLRTAFMTPTQRLPVTQDNTEPFQTREDTPSAGDTRYPDDLEAPNPRSTMDGVSTTTRETRGGRGGLYMRRKRRPRVHATGGWRCTLPRSRPNRPVTKQQVYRERWLRPPPPSPPPPALFFESSLELRVSQIVGARNGSVHQVGYVLSATGAENRSSAGLATALMATMWSVSVCLSICSVLWGPHATHSISGAASGERRLGRGSPLRAASSASKWTSPRVNVKCQSCV